jgi:hypothetical protein
MTSRKELSNVMLLRKTARKAFASSGPVKAAVLSRKWTICEVDTLLHGYFSSLTSQDSMYFLPVSINHQKYCKALNSAFATEVAFDPKFASVLKSTGQDAKKAVQIKDCIIPLATAEKSVHHSFTQLKNSGMTDSRFSGATSVEANVKGIV